MSKIFENMSVKNMCLLSTMFTIACAPHHSQRGPHAGGGVHPRANPNAAVNRVINRTARRATTQGLRTGRGALNEATDGGLGQVERYTGPADRLLRDLIPY